MAGNKMLKAKSISMLRININKIATFYKILILLNLLIYYIYLLNSYHSKNIFYYFL